jgi:hypothetical protein
MRVFADPAAEFVPACRRSFGDVRVLDGSRAVLVGDTKLSLESGERELWLVEMHGVLEQHVAVIEVRGDIERAVREAKERLDG